MGKYIERHKVFFNKFMRRIEKQMAGERANYANQRWILSSRVLNERRVYRLTIGPVKHELEIVEEGSVVIIGLPLKYYEPISIELLDEYLRSPEIEREMERIVDSFRTQPCQDKTPTKVRQDILPLAVWNFDTESYIQVNYDRGHSKFSFKKPGKDELLTKMFVTLDDIEYYELAGERNVYNSLKFRIEVSIAELGVSWKRLA